MVSSSYDKTLRVWEAQGAALREAACLQGHGAPVLQLACEAGTGLLASGKPAMRVGGLVALSC